jgi:PPOX class probable F420-dependent enzyme
MTELHPEARKLIESDRLAHMVTLNPDGSPQVSCVWVGLEGDEVVSAHLPRNRKVKNVEREPRVAISIEGTGISEAGLREYLVISGIARSRREARPSCCSASRTSISAPTSGSRRWTTRPPAT